MSTHWTFLTNHAHLLLAVARDPDARVHDLAGRVGISDRAALMILEDLEHAGYLERERVGRRNRYTVHPHRPFRHPTTAAHEVDELLAIFAGPAERSAREPATGAAAGVRPGPTDRGGPHGVRGDAQRVSLPEGATAARPASSRAMGTRNGEQDT